MAFFFSSLVGHAFPARHKSTYYSFSFVIFIFLKATTTTTATISTTPLSPYFIS